jgi:glutathione S-transferase
VVRRSALIDRRERRILARGSSVSLSEETLMLRLYGTPQTRTFRPLWMLEELGVPYELVKTDFASGDTRTAEFLRINPNGHVPALVDGDLALFESMAINLHLAERYGSGGLWPATADDRARAVQWSFWVMTECEAPLFDVLFGRGGAQFEKWRAWMETEEFRATHPGASPPTRAEVEDRARRAEAALQPPLRVLDAQLASREHVLGAGFGVADLNLASVWVTARLARLDLSGYPNVDAWLARCLSRPAVARAATR